MSLVGSLYTGKSAMIARQTEMSTIGSNIAKADMEGYHRQEAILVENFPLETGNLQIGTGTHVEQVIRHFDAALENNLENALEQQSYYEYYHKHLKTLEQVVAQDGESLLTDAFTEFSNSLQDLAKDPESETYRRSVLANAERLATTFNDQYATMENVRDQIASSDTVGELPDKVDDLNELAVELAQINQMIVHTEASMIRNQKAIDFRDQRDQIIKEMAKLAEVSFTEETDGSYTVVVGATTMVTGDIVNDTLSHSLTAGPPPSPSITWTTGGGALNSPNGAISGLKDAYDYIQARIDDVEDFATALADEINAQQALGYNLNGALGGPMFVDGGGGALSVAFTDPDLIAAADNDENTGDGDNALAMWNRLYTPVGAIGNDTLRNHSDRFVDVIAIEKSRAEAMLNSSESSVEMFKTLIAEKTGVSIDEEMVDMLETQRAFQGAAKFIRAVDELINTVINIV